MQIERADQSVIKAEIGDHFVFIEDDFNKWTPNDKQFAGVMCHHALHHVQDLEHLFQSIRTALHPQGVFCTFDVIGRNGHMRWPEALEIITRIWAFLPKKKKYHHLLKQIHENYINWDCSSQGFEGIRSQDILPLLNDFFHFNTFLAFGNLIDVFTSRGYGANFDPNDRQDTAFIEFIQYLNDLLIDIGYIKPTRMCAVMSLEESENIRCYKNWTPKFCIRNPDL